MTVLKRLAKLEKRISIMEKREEHRLAILKHLRLHRVRASIRDKLKGERQ